MAICYFCKRVDFKNAQAVRAQLRGCRAYQNREEEEQLYRAVRSLEAIHAPAGLTDTQLRARYEAEQVARGRRPAPRALCSFCGRSDFRNGQAVRAHLQRCEAYRARRQTRRRRRQESRPIGRKGSSRG